MKSFTEMNLGENAGIPIPAVTRLCALYRLLCDLSARGVSSISSGEIGERLGVEAHSIRRDIGYVSDGGSGKNGYGVERLKERIAARFGFANGRKACVAGLGRLGRALLRDGQDIFGDLKIAAGFDSDVNLVETMSADVPVYPSYEITDVVKRLGIDMAILTVPDANAQECAERLVKGGVRGIINFTSEHLKTGTGVTVRNVDLSGEFRILSALMFLNN